MDRDNGSKGLGHSPVGLDGTIKGGYDYPPVFFFSVLPTRLYFFLFLGWGVCLAVTTGFRLDVFYFVSIGDGCFDNVGFVQFCDLVSRPCDFLTNDSGKTGFPSFSR